MRERERETERERLRERVLGRVLKNIKSLEFTVRWPSYRSISI